MRTLIVSDLHLGGAAGADVLGRAAAREAFFKTLAGFDRLVALGDVLELRHGPRRDALAGARPFFEQLGRQFAGREVVVVAGNHDHALVESWLRRHSEIHPQPNPLDVEQRFAATEASSMLATLAEWASPANVTAAYPGLWLREDVYATHGHYLDCHLTVPTMERLGIAATGRFLRRPTDSLGSVEDYEAVSTPVFAWIDAIARHSSTGSTLNGQSTVRIWRALGGDGAGGEASRRDLRTKALAGAFPVAVAALNRLGVGRFGADISGPELRRAGLRGMGEVAERLGLGDAHVVFGHTHRMGPLPQDDAGEWVGPSGARLLNGGCWTYDHHFLAGSSPANPYWPGGAVIVEETGPPRLARLLDDCGPGELFG